jgi:hypothetical protein
LIILIILGEEFTYTYACIKYIFYQITVQIYLGCYVTWGRSQWPHEPSSSARTLESWAQISLEAWMSVCILYLCCSVCR